MKQGDSPLVAPHLTSTALNGMLQHVATRLIMV
jgi:hypothetical protein